MHLASRLAFYIVAFISFPGAAPKPWPANHDIARMYKDTLDDGPEGQFTIQKNKRLALEPLLKKQKADAPDDFTHLLSEACYETRPFPVPEDKAFQILKNCFENAKCTLQDLMTFSFQDSVGKTMEEVPSEKPKEPSFDVQPRKLGGLDLDDYKRLKDWHEQIYKVYVSYSPDINKLIKLEEKAKAAPSASSQTARQEFEKGVVDFMTNFPASKELSILVGIMSKEVADFRSRLGATNLNMKEYFYFFGNLDEILTIARQGIYGETKLVIFPAFRQLKDKWVRSLQILAEMAVNALRISQAMYLVNANRKNPPLYKDVYNILKQLKDYEGLLVFWMSRFEELDSFYELIDSHNDKLMEKLELSPERRKDRNARSMHRRARLYGRSVFNQ